MSDKPLNWYVNIYYVLPLIVASCLSFNTWEGKHYISRLVVLMLFITILKSRDVIKNNLSDFDVRKILSYWLVVAALFSLFSIFRGESFGVARTIFVSLIYIIVVPWKKINKNLVLLSIMLGGVTAGGFSIYERVSLGVIAVGGVINSIPFATYATITCLVSINAYFISQSKFVKLMAFLSTAGSTYAIVMSDVRGIWLAIIVVSLFYLLNYIVQYKIKNVVVLCIAFLVGGIFISSSIDIERRVKQTEIEFQAINNGNYDTSIGLRLQLWRSAIEMIKAHPFTGLGTVKYKKEMELQYQNGLITSTALSFKDSHFHNQLLDSYVRYGIIGLLLVIMMSISPIILTHRVKTDFRHSFIGVSILIAIAGLTDVPFMHTGLIYILFLYPAAIFLSRK
ncbi:TPA: O-antigen ligase family protein [Aeromonas sobria]|nr:O-antigen ligase family protein [Aeromonas sobria]